MQVLDASLGCSGTPAGKTSMSDSYIKIAQLKTVDAFRDIEERHVLSLHLQCHVIATGGSVIYSDRSMGHLQGLGRIVFLDVPLDELQSRATGIGTRGLVIAPGMSFSELCRERIPLYKKWADLIIDCGSKTPDAVVSEITRRLSA